MAGPFRSRGPQCARNTSVSRRGDRLIQGTHRSSISDVLPCFPMIKSASSFQSPVRIGCAGWSIPGSASSQFADAGTHLERYCRVFNCCEINSSFSRSHKKETWQRWAKIVPDEFRFSVKIPKAITHQGRLHCSPEILSEFLHQISFLGEKLGPILVQLPPSLEFVHSVADKFLSHLRQSCRTDIVWEPRHPSWFEDAANDLLKDYQVTRVAADPACVPAAKEPGGISELVYFRLHGSPRRYYSSYDSEFLRKLSFELQEMATKSRIWCIFDNTASGSAIHNALALKTAGDER